MTRVSGNGRDPNAALRAVSDAVLSISSELSVEPMLQKIVDAARELTGARYAALGLPDGGEGFARFITSGMTDEQYAAIGPLPRKHGLLGAMLQDPSPYRTPDIQKDPRFQWWPDAHPRMKSFLGVPIVSQGEIIAAFYLTDKTLEQRQAAPGMEGRTPFAPTLGPSMPPRRAVRQGERAEFTDDDQQLVEMLAAHTAIALQNARLYERSRELSVIEERNRLARDLHDSVVQRLFSVMLTAEAAVTLIERSPAEAREQVQRVQELARDSIQEMRSLIFELRPADLESDGLVPTLRKHIDVLRRVRGAEIVLHVTGERRLRADIETAVYRIAQEALNNALKHSGAAHIGVDLAIGKADATLVVRDDGSGFDPADPALRLKRLGLTAMEERAEAVNGELRIDSAPGRGTEVSLEVPLGR